MSEEKNPDIHIYNTLTRQKDVFEPVKQGKVKMYVCGPETMMKKITLIIDSKKIQAEFSLESIMGCGFGACWGCVRRMKKNKEETLIKVCEEGPVFSKEDIIWE